MSALPTDEVDDDAAVGDAPRGIAEVGHAVRRVRRGQVVRDAVHAQVAGVRQGVAEAEDGRVLPRHGRPRQQQSQARQQQTRHGAAAVALLRSRPRPRRPCPACLNSPVGTRSSDGHTACRLNADVVVNDDRWIEEQDYCQFHGLIRSSGSKSRHGQAKASG
jgi:predicted transcriptional regulator